MSDLVWLKQSKDKPLFEDLLWSRPENKAFAGKLLIIGGSSSGFSAPALSYEQASKAGVGNLSVLMPESLKASFGPHLEAAVFCPSNTSGSFGRSSLAEFLDRAAWADLTLLAGDFGHNSETAILIESFLKDYKDCLCLSGDSIDSFLNSPTLLFNRPETFLVIESTKLQKLLIRLKTDKVITSTMSLVQIIEQLSKITSDYPIGLVTKHDHHLILAYKGQISTTEDNDLKNWTLKLAAYCSVWWLQNKTEPFKAITTAIYDSINSI